MWTLVDDENIDHRLPREGEPNKALVNKALVGLYTKYLRLILFTSVRRHCAFPFGSMQT